MTLGVLGGGQLGRMLALAGLPLGLRFRFLDPARDAPAARAGEHVRAGYDDRDALERFAAGLTAATYEFENVPAETVHSLEAHGIAVHPPVAALAAAQDRLVEKDTFRALGIPTAEYEGVGSGPALRAAVERLGAPAIAKTRRLGYDGKGQRLVEDACGAEAAWSELGAVPLIVERRVEFERELSMLAVRRSAGEVAFYPLIENEHRSGILRVSLAPASGSAGELQRTAETYAARLLDHFRYAGVLAIELFQTPYGLLANEMAPRVHNSGHWTIEGAETSQFENHLRAILDLPLGSTAPRGHAGMANLIGDIPERRPLLAIRDAHLHLYGKAPRPGRKLGHVTVLGSSPAERDARLWQAVELAAADSA